MYSQKFRHYLFLLFGVFALISLIACDSSAEEPTEPEPVVEIEPEETTEPEEEPEPEEIELIEVHRHGYWTDEGFLRLRVERDFEEGRERRTDAEHIDIDYDLIIELRPSDESENIYVYIYNNSSYFLSHLRINGYMENGRELNVSYASGFIESGESNSNRVRMQDVQLSDFEYLYLTEISVTLRHPSRDSGSGAIIMYDVEEDYYFIRFRKEMLTPSDTPTIGTGDSDDWQQFLIDYDEWMTRFIENPTDSEMLAELLEWSDRKMEIQGALSGSDLLEFVEESLRIEGRMLE